MEAHDVLGLLIIVGATGGAVAAIGSLFSPRMLPMVRTYLRFMLIGVAVQALIGLVLVATGHRPGQAIHWFYGIATLLALPLCWWMSGPLQGRRRQLWVVGGAVATALFALRALMTG